jgi:glycosyltransferase involved in cell wall biosynthesis
MILSHNIASQNQGTKVLVAHRANPELNHLAAAISQQGILYKHIRPFIQRDRIWEKVLKKLSPNIYENTIARRKMPDGLEQKSVDETGVVEDWAMALLREFSKLPFSPNTDRALTNLNRRIWKQIEKKAAYFAQEVDIIIGNNGVALMPFEESSCFRVLNYPIAHHTFMQNLFLDELENEPEFACTLPWLDNDSDLINQLNQECNLANRILVGSSFAKDTHVTMGVPPEKIYIVPYGMESSLFVQEKKNRAYSRNAFEILFVGQLTQRKGISYLLKAYQIIQGPNTTLTLVGNFFKERKPLEAFSYLFKHIPHIPRASLAEIYQKADVFVFPTLADGMPLVVIEAMASGLPVIVTPNGPGDIVRDGIDGFIVPLRDVDAIVEKLEHLRANPEARIEMGRNAQERAKLFTWENYTNAAMAAIFDDVEIHPGLSQ